MPELPEVEAARRAIHEHCVGKKIVKSVVADDSKVIDGVSPTDFEAAVVGKTIVAAYRKGKNMWLQLDSPPFPSFQFGMAGAIYIKGVAVTKYKQSAVKDTDEWPSKYSKLFIELDDGLEFSFTDKRRFAKVRLLGNPVSVAPISELGPDALLEPMTVDEFYNSLGKKKIGIKALLLDQSFISGIGNWMADEVLYQARIHPLQTASSLSKESCATLLKCINEVIEEAIEVGADSSQFPSNWIFHSREKKPGKAFVDGKKIEFITAGGRTSAYVPELQKLGGNQARKAAGESSNSIEESENEEATDSRKSKVLSGRKTTVEKPSSTRKSKGSDGESNNDEYDDKHIKKTRGGKKPPPRSKSKGRNENDDQKKKSEGKKTPAKRKPEESDNEDDVDNASGSTDDDEEDHKVMDKKRGKAGTLSKSKVGTNQNGTQRKKAAK